MAAKILVIEDEKQIADVIAAYMARDGHSVEWAKDGMEGMAKFSSFSPDLIVLDLMLPFMSGEELIRRIRQTSAVPVIMLTAKAAENDIVSGLDLGADDYLPKPFSPKELSARVKALLRRFEVLRNSKRRVFRIGSLTVDLDRKEVHREDVPIRLTRNEYLIFEALIMRKDRALSRDELIRQAFGDDFEGYDRTIDSHIKNLRKKLQADGDSTEYIETVHGIGYRIGGGFA